MDLNKATGEVLMPLERLLTLDRQAHEPGYGPGPTRDLPAAGA
ncbi:MAG: hypothetical protein Q8O40_10450 [Chloroflexota bacterium]|nr:hypothetical protein [Chloroflexota bacterium]